MLTRLVQANRTTVFLLTLAFMLVALFTPGIVGALLLLALAAGLTALLRHTWPVLASGPRALRVVVIVLLVVAAINKIT
jgi:hypothetical protein